MKAILLQNGLLVGFFSLKSSNLQGIVVVEKTQMSEQYFPAMQKFTVLDLGMVLLPVASQTEASCLLVQLVSTHSRSSTIALPDGLSPGLRGSFTPAAAFTIDAIRQADPCHSLCWFIKAFRGLELQKLPLQPAELAAHSRQVDNKVNKLQT